MPGKQNTYTLGEYGVNRVKSPVHLVDGELLTAQNAAVPFEKGNRGLAKRAGMSKLNAEAAAGPILAMSWIPLPDPTEDALAGPGSAGGFEVFVDGVSFTTMRTTNGSTFTGKNVAGRASAFTAFTGIKSYYYDGRLYYVGGTVGQILYYDGSASGVECTLPSTHPVNGQPLSAVDGLCGLGNTIYVLGRYNSPYYQVLQSVVGSGAMTVFCEGLKNTIGATAGFILRSRPTGPVAYQGRVWVPCADQPGTDGSYLNAAPGSTTWAEDRTTAGRYPWIAGVSADSLWFTSAVGGATNHQLERRNADGSYTVVRGPQAASICAVGGIGQRVYVLSSSNLERTTDNGTSFTTIATGTISSSTGAVGKVTQIGTTYYLLLNLEMIRDDGASVTELSVGGGNFLSAFVRI